MFAAKRFVQFAELSTLKFSEYNIVVSGGTGAGTTTLLNFGVGLTLRLNQPILQTINYLLTAGQLALILVYVRLGEFIWRADRVPLSVSQILADFRTSPKLFFQRFGWTGVHAFTAWVLTAPFLIAAIYFAARPLLRRLAARAASGLLSSIK